MARNECRLSAASLRSLRDFLYRVSLISGHRPSRFLVSNQRALARKCKADIIETTGAEKKRTGQGLKEQSTKVSNFLGVHSFFLPLEGGAEGEG